jgi:hypothetical protein
MWAWGAAMKDCKTPDPAWFDMETTEEGEVFFTNIALAEGALTAFCRTPFQLAVSPFWLN